MRGLFPLQRCQFRFHRRGRHNRSGSSSLDRSTQQASNRPCAGPSNSQMVCSYDLPVFQKFDLDSPGTKAGAHAATVHESTLRMVQVDMCGRDS